MRRLLLCGLLAVTLFPSLTTMADEPKVSLDLTYPAGKSPKVFTKGWLFGAKCTIDGKDFSKNVQWSGTGSFSPSIGHISRPTFAAKGPNKIVLTIVNGKQKITKQYAIQAVDPFEYAAVGDQAHCPADAHGCPACPHPVTGKIASGSPQVLVNGKPAARKGDKGVHAACCGPNTFEIVSGDPEVLINGRPAARRGDATKHCGGTGMIGEAAFAIEGKFKGPVAGDASGTMAMTVKNNVITGTFTTSEGGGISHTGKVSGSVDRITGKVKGTINGKVSYSIGDSKYSDPFKGSFEGNATQSTIKCEWKARTTGSSPLNRKGTFSLMRSK